MKAGRAVGGCCDVVSENGYGPRMAHSRLGSRKGKVGGPSCDLGGMEDGPGVRDQCGSLLAVGVLGTFRLAQPGSAHPCQILPPS